MKTVMAALAAAAFLAGCGGGDGGSPQPPPAISLPVAPHTGAPGSIDTSFATGGVFVFPPSAIPDSYTTADSVAQLESGKLLLSGTYRARRFGAQQIGLLVRLLPDGSRDTSFLGSGVLQFTGSLVESVQATRLLPVPGDRVIWAHFDASSCASSCGTGDPHPAHLFVRRLDAAGIVENTYGTFGTATGHVRPHDLAAAPDGSMVVVAEAFGEPASSTSPVALALDASGKLVRETPLAGRPEGHCAFEGDAAAQLRAARQPDGKVLVLWISTNASRQEICLARLDAGANPDGSFGVGGFAAIANVAGADVPVTLLARRDGGSVGVFVMFDTNVRGNELVFFDAAGNLDTSRGEGGVHRDVETGMRTFTAAALQPDEKIIVAGTTLDNDRLGVSRIARYDASGAIDRGFGPAGTGVATLSAGGRTLVPARLAVAADWSILVAGTTGAICPALGARCDDPQAMALVKVIGGDR